MSHCQVRVRNKSEPNHNIQDSDVKRSRFERRRIFSRSKQGSFEVPDDVKNWQPEDNVFSEWKRSCSGLPLQRSYSMPAMLPDVVLGAGVSCITPFPSPDVLSNQQSDFPPCLKNASVSEHCLLDCNSKKSAHMMLQDREKKRDFEGSSYCNHAPEEVKRRRSVTFKTNCVSDETEKRRSQFRKSSGYGSQSEGSQFSCASSTQDDVIEENSVDFTSTRVDGSIDGGSSDEKKKNGSLSGCKSEDCVQDTQETKPTTAGESSEVGPGFEDWNRENSPKFHFTETADNQDNGIDIPDRPACAAEGNGGSSARGSYHSDFTRISPTTKEEFEYELARHQFLDRMLKFDPNAENTAELLEWAKNDLPQLFSSPNSPFYQAGGGSPKNFQISPAVMEILKSGNTAAKHPLDISLLSQVNGESQKGCAPATVFLPQGLALIYEESTRQPTVPAPVSGQSGGGPAACRTLAVPNPAITPGPMGIAESPSQHPISDESLEIQDFSTGICVSLLEKVVNLSQCTFSRCNNQECVKFKEDMRLVKKWLMRGPCDRNSNNWNTLRVLREHYMSCELPNCQVPWCRYIFRMHVEKDRIQQDLMALLSNPLHILLPDNKYYTFYKLDTTLPYNQMPKEWDDWLVIFPMSNSYSIAKVSPFAPASPQIYWVVKVSVLHEGGNQLEVLKKLRNLNKVNIVKHLWAAVSKSRDLVVCTEFFTDFTVRDLLDQKDCLSWAETREYLEQILMALQYLHQLNIVYLNWSCSNILVDRHAVKVSNLTMSVDLSRDPVDVDDVKMSLPADVVPFELITERDKLCQKSDSWGLACLLHEMLTGHRPWFHLRHQRQEDIWAEIVKQVPLELPCNLPHGAKHFLETCFQKKPKSRPSANDLIEHLQTAWHTE